jgi:fructose-bisphosphate aldolase class II
MTLVSMKSILVPAKTRGYAVPAFDAMDHASAEGVLLAAEKTNRPVILMVPESGMPLFDADRFLPFLVRSAENAHVPVALQIDHGKTLEHIMKCICAGFTSVMIDGSALPESENIRLTKEIVKIAHAASVDVEGEIGHVGSAGKNMETDADDASMYTEPEDAARFAEATGVDALAVSFGTAHGIYKGTPKLDIERLRSIRDIVPVPLVMHGGSGLSDNDFTSSIASGICKINIFTEISTAAAAQAVAYAETKGGKVHFAEIASAGKQTVAALAEKYLTLFSMGTGV